METTEKVVEAYVRYIMKCFTIPNIKCPGQHEIDLLAMRASDAGNMERFHVESSVSISQGFSKLTNNNFSETDLKDRVKQAGQRRTLEYFVKRKFNRPEVTERLKEFGFEPGSYKKMFVTWDWTEDVPGAAAQAGVDLWDFKDVLQKTAAAAISGRTYYTDDTMRTLQLVAMALKQRPEIPGADHHEPEKSLS